MGRITRPAIRVKYQIEECRAPPPWGYPASHGFRSENALLLGENHPLTVKIKGPSIVALLLQKHHLPVLARFADCQAVEIYA